MNPSELSERIKGIYQVEPKREILLRHILLQGVKNKSQLEKFSIPQGNDRPENFQNVSIFQESRENSDGINAISKNTLK